MDVWFGVGLCIISWEFGGFLLDDFGEGDKVIGVELIGSPVEGNRYIGSFGFAHRESRLI